MMQPHQERFPSHGRSKRHFRWLSGIVTAIVISQVTLPPRKSQADASPEPEPSLTGGSPSELHQDVLYGVPIDGGYVIVRGEFLEGPYRIGRRGQEVLINGMPIAGPPGASSGKRRGRSRVNLNQLMATLEQRLYQGEVLIVFDARTRLFLWDEDAAYFLQALVDADSVEARIQEVLGHAEETEDGGTAGIPTSQWRIALADFKPTDGLLTFLDDMGVSDDEEEWVEECEATYLGYDPTRWMCVLNVAGMVLVVVSAGTLLGHRPRSGVHWSQPLKSERLSKLVFYCVGLILSLSAFDLVATLLTNASGGFMELNPFAHALTKTPVILSGFKLTATGLAVGILWHRRIYAGAQQAAWWLCLILTLVTIRWVTIQSMFYV